MRSAALGFAGVHIPADAVFLLKFDFPPTFIIISYFLTPLRPSTPFDLSLAFLFCRTKTTSSEMANPCPTPYQYYTCSNPPFVGCCSVDPCSGLGCPPDSQYFVSTASIGPASATTQPTETAQSSSSRSITSRTLKITRTITGPGGSVSTETSITVSVSTARLDATASSTQLDATASSTQLDATASSTQQSPTASPTQSGAKSPGHSSSPLLSIIAISIGGALGILIIALIIFLYRRRRRRRKSENSTGGLPTHGGVPEPTLDDGPVTGISNLTQNPALTPH